MENKHKHGGKSSESILDKNIILEALKVHSGQTIFDAGCGNGYMSKEFAKLVGSNGKVYSIDIHEESINQFKKDINESNIVVMLCDITKKTSVDDASVELVYLSTVFHGFTALEREGFLSETKRILKDKGVLAIVEINKKNTPFGPPTDIRFSPEELVKAVDLKSKNLVPIGDYFYMQTFLHEI